MFGKSKGYSQDKIILHLHKNLLSLIKQRIDYQMRIDKINNRVINSKCETVDMFAKRKRSDISYNTTMQLIIVEKISLLETIINDIEENKL